jgi:hypothetical protein
MSEMLDAYWEVCLVNESGGEGNVLSDAKMDSGENGYSFGVKQFDLKTNGEGGDILAQTLAAALGSGIVTEADISAIRGGALKRTAGQVDADASLTALKKRVNAALALTPVRERLHTLTRDWMAGEVTALDTDIDAISNAVGGRSFVQSSETARLLLLDYKNFFGKNIPKFISYLSGGNPLLNGTQPLEPVAGEVSLTDLFRFVLWTKQGSGPGRTQRADTLRRLNNVVRIGKSRDAAPIASTTKDKLWLTEVLKPMLGSANQFVRRQRESGALEELANLIATGT